MSGKSSFYDEQMKDFNNFISDSKAEFRRFKNSGQAYSPMEAAIKPQALIPNGTKVEKISYRSVRVSVINYSFKNYKEAVPVTSSVTQSMNQAVPINFISIINDFSNTDFFNYYDKSTYLQIALITRNNFKFNYKDNLLPDSAIYTMLGYITAREEDNWLIHLRINYSYMAYQRKDPFAKDSGQYLLTEDYDLMTSQEKPNVTSNKF